MELKFLNEDLNAPVTVDDCDTNSDVQPLNLFAWRRLATSIWKM